MDEVITKTRVACGGWSEREYYIIIRCVKYKGSRVGCEKGGRVVSVLFCVLLLDCFACVCHFKFGYWVLWCYMYFVFICVFLLGVCLLFFCVCSIRYCYFLFVLFCIFGGIKYVCIILRLYNLLKWLIQYCIYIMP